MIKIINQNYKFQDATRIKIVGPGPSIQLLQNLDGFDLAIFIGDSFKRTALRSPVRNAYVRANSEYPNLSNESHINDMLEFEGELYLASSVQESCISVRRLVESALPDKTVSLFDQRHFAGKDCSPKRECCENKLETTIQEILATEIGFGHTYSSGMTVLAHAMAIALLSNAEHIEVIGVDLPLKTNDYKYGGIEFKKNINSTTIKKFKKLFTGKFDVKVITQYLKTKVASLLLGINAPSVFAQDFMELFTDFQYLSDAASVLGCKVTVIGKDSTLLRIHGMRPA